MTEKTPLVPKSPPPVTQETGLDGDAGSGGIIIQDAPKSVASTSTYDELKRKAQIEQLAELYIKCTRQHRMHRLSHEYFHKRDAAFNFFPLLLITMISAILSFLATVDLFEPNIRQIFSISVSIFAIFSVAVQSYAKYANYDYKAEMHRNAALGMLKIGDRIQVLFSDPDLRIPADAIPSELGGDAKPAVPSNINGPTEAGNVGRDEELGDGQSVVPASPDDNSKLNMQNLSIQDKIGIHQMLYDQVIETIDSTFPPPVTQTFGIMDARLNISFRTKFTHKKYDQHLQVEPDLVVWLSERLIKIAAYNEIYAELSNSRGWPWWSANPHKTVERAIARVHRTYVESTKSFLAVDVHMDETIWTLCAWTFCCCFDPTSWFWACCVKMRRRQLEEQRIVIDA